MLLWIDDFLNALLSVFNFFFALNSQEMCFGEKKRNHILPPKVFYSLILAK
jgi:hypothetical protein